MAKKGSILENKLIIWIIVAAFLVLASYFIYVNGKALMSNTSPFG